VAAALVVVGCGSSSSAGTGGDGSAGTGGDDSSAFVATLEHTFDPVVVDPGADAYWCQSWTLDNDKPLYVTKVRQFNDGGWHHSNWFFVPDDQYGEDGLWKCRDRGFEEVSAGIEGGVIFAQSTQSPEEVQAFPEGSALVVPARSKIIGNAHLLNVAASQLETTLTMGIQAIEEEEVETKLRLFTLRNTDIVIPPGGQSRMIQTCDIGQWAPKPFNFHYVLAHYHQWGNYFRVSFVHDDGSETTILELDNVGDHLGHTIDPPISSLGTGKIKYECGYNNTTDRELHWGNKGEEEMCVLFGYTDADLTIAAYPEDNVPVELDPEGGIRMFDIPCEGGFNIGLPPNE